MTDTQLAAVNEFVVRYEEATIHADFDAMQARLDELLEPYKGLTAEAVAKMPEGDVKSCYRDLNAIRTSVEDGRKAIKREYNKPLADFEARVRGLVEQIDKPRALLKEAKDMREEAAKADRLNALAATYWEFAPMLAEMVPVEKLIDQRWLNKSYGEKKAENELCDRVAALNADWSTLKETQLHFPAETERRFFDSLSLREALAYDRGEWEKQQGLDAMKAQVEEVRATQEPIKVTAEMIGDPVEHVYTIEIPAQQFRATDIEKTALINHLRMLGVHGSVKRMKEAVA